MDEREMGWDYVRPADFEERMRALAEDAPDEEGHLAMDGLMCKVLRQFGYGAGVDVYEATPKWYA